MNEIILNFFIFISGTIFGSFVNVLIDRIPRRKDIIFKRSHCDYCKTTLGALDLIPVFSYLFLKGRCRYCRKKISMQNPLVEIATGAFFVFIFKINFPFIPIIFFQFLISGILIAIFVIDLKSSIIPDSLVVALMVLTFIYKLIFQQNLIITDFAAGVVFASFFIMLIFLTRGKGMGMGDAKFALFMGFYLGFLKLLVAFYISFLTGAVISLILILLGLKKFKSAIPFGPFLITGTVIAEYFSEQIYLMIQKIF